MEKREVVRLVIEGKRPPYVPWQFGFTKEAREALQQHYGAVDIEDAVENHFVRLGRDIGYMVDLGGDRVRDHFGVVWDRSVDKDIGIVQGQVLPEPTLAGYSFPDPRDPQFFGDIPGLLERYPDRFRVFAIGFSLYERAWTLRGLQSLLMDFHDHPRFVRDLLRAIADYNIAQIEEALKYDIDAVYFGDDWGQQHGLQMGAPLWREFIKPELKRMYAAVHEGGKYVMIHSCGDVDELFDELIEIGLDCFNPFQPEVMDVDALMRQYRGRLAFWGGLSLQRTLPYGSVDDVRRETRHLLELGAEGGLIVAPSHDVEGDVPLQNMLAFIDTVQQQPAFARP
jgi:uroporphyrinogen decarboxylase